jgi:uncharacterized protein (DUF2062 family)
MEIRQITILILYQANYRLGALNNLLYTNNPFHYFHIHVRVAFFSVVLESTWRNIRGLSLLFLALLDVSNR